MRRILCAALLLLASPLHAQKTDDAILDDLYAVKALRQVAISPDGRRVAWSLTVDGADTIRVANADGSSLQQVSAGKNATDERVFTWSPDSSTLAFRSDAGNSSGQRQLYVAKIGSAPRKLTDISGWIDAPRFSPDGKSIAALVIEKARRAAGPLVAMSRAVGVIEETIEEQRVAIIDVASGKLRFVTPADMYVYELDWSPDGRKLVTIAVPGSGDANWWFAKLHVVDVAAATMKPVYTPKWQIADPHWSPDGTRIAFIEGLMSDAGSTGGDVMMVEANGSDARNVTPAMKGSATSLEWRDTETIAVAANIRGESALLSVASGGKLQTTYQTPDFITAGDVIGASYSRDHSRIAVIRSSLSQPSEVWTGPAGSLKQISHENDGVTERAGAAKSITWTTDAGDVQGWLVSPTNLEPGKKYPMVVWIHGGPASASLNKWPHEEAILLSRHGFFVFYPNPRGSYGQGEAFTQGNIKDFGGGDLRDILGGIDAVAKEDPVDPKRVGIWGWSYGGYMTMWTVTQTDRFRAAVAGAGIANWQSYYGQNDIDQWMLPYFGASVYDDPAVYAKSSPLSYIKNVKTPTLILAGERDGEVPAPQSFEFWHALKTLGVETQLVVYPDEGHHFLKPEHRRDVSRRVVAWFTGHL